MKERVEFGDWLRNNTNLSEGSISLYVRTINRFKGDREGQDLTKPTSEMIQSVNSFVADSFRESSSLYVKYVFKHYLKWIGHEDAYKKIIPVKMKPRKKTGKFYPKAVIIDLIEHVKDKKLRDNAALQYALGGRAREIITLREENIDTEFSRRAMRLRLLGKGGKERITYLDIAYRPILEQYFRGRAGYLFLKNRTDYDESMLNKAIETYRKYYYNAIEEAARSIGLDGFGTHDFRRNVADQVRKITKDPYVVKKVLGHADIRTTLRYFDESSEEIEDPMLAHQAGSMKHDKT